MWNRKFHEQQRLVTSLQHEVHVLQSSLSKSAVTVSTRPVSPAAPPWPCPAASTTHPPPRALEAPVSSPITAVPRVREGRPSHPSLPSPFSPAPRPQGRVTNLLVCDSVTRTLVYPKLENPTGALLKQVNAYSAHYDERAFKPEKNVNAVIRRELNKAQYHTLILGAPSVDITNQDVTEGIMDENMSETLLSSLGMVEAADYAIKSGKAKQVILLEHIPRYDTKETDPMGVRPKLAKLANQELKKARDASDYAQHIMVGQHTGLQCDDRIRVNRFTSDHTYVKHNSVRMGKYDGVHMYSKVGAEALTKSLLTVLNKAGMVRQPNKWNLSSSSSSFSGEQWRIPPTGRGFRANSWEQGRRDHRLEFQLPIKNRFQNLW
jgi:hypothetical protein